LNCASHDPKKAYGFVGVVISLKDLSSSIWVWYREKGTNGNGSKGNWAIKKVIEIPAEPADPEKLPPLLKGFKAAAPLLTDINLSVDDRYLYASCWVPVSSSSTMSVIHLIRKKSVPSGWEAWSAARLTPASPSSP